MSLFQKKLLDYCLLLNFIWISVRSEEIYPIAVYNGLAGIDYTETSTNNCKIKIETNRDILNNCKLEQEEKCDFCEDLDIDSTSATFVFISNFYEGISGRIFIDGKLYKINTYSTTNEIVLLLYGGDTSIKGIIKNNGVNQYMNWLANDPSLDYPIIPTLGDSILAACYNYEDDILYYVNSTNAIISVNNGIQKTLNQLPLNVKIVSAEIDLYYSEIYLAATTVESNLSSQEFFIEIYHIDKESIQSLNFENLEQFSLGSITFPAVNARTILKKSANGYFYISNGPYMVKVKNFDSQDKCDLSCSVVSFEVSDIGTVYFSCEGSRNISRMDPQQFCAVNPFTLNVFPQPPLFVRYSNPYGNQEVHRELPFWFKYAVGGGAALLALILIFIIACFYYKCKIAKRNTTPPSLPPGLTSLNYASKQQEDNYYTNLDIESLEPTPTMKKKILAESVYVDLIAPATLSTSTTNQGFEISQPNYDQHEAVEEAKTSNKNNTE